MKHIIIILLCAVCSAAFSQKEDMVVRGEIVTKEKGELQSVPGARIVWSQDKGIAVSEVNGTFKIEVKSLPDTLIVTAMCFSFRILQSKNLTPWLSTVGELKYLSLRISHKVGMELIQMVIHARMVSIFSSIQELLQTAQNLKVKGIFI